MTPKSALQRKPDPSAWPLLQPTRARPHTIRSVQRG